MKLIAPSILSADFSKLGEEVRAVESAGADWIHIDVMDGHFVPNITIGPFIVEAVKKMTKLPLDVHLMIENPEDFVEKFIHAGADSVTIHIEASQDHAKTLKKIRQLKAKSSIALNPATPLTAIQHLVGEVDMVLVMTVNPGFGGQKFIPEAEGKIAPLRELIQATGKDIMIEVDGGINLDNIGRLSQLGANVFVAGSAIFGSQDYKKTIRGMIKNARASITCP